MSTSDADALPQAVDDEYGDSETDVVGRLNRLEQLVEVFQQKAVDADARAEDALDRAQRAESRVEELEGTLEELIKKIGGDEPAPVDDVLSRASDAGINIGTAEDEIQKLADHGDIIKYPNGDGDEVAEWI